MTEAAALIRDQAPGFTPKLGLVLGSGLGPLADEVAGAVRIPYTALPGFPRSGVSGHAGAVVLGTLAGLPVAVFAGRAHYYEHGNANEMRVPIETLKALGAEALLLTNAAGSTVKEVGPGNVMLITDHINFAGANPLIGTTSGDNRFVGLSDAYDRSMSVRLRSVAQREQIPLAEGVYMWFSGPSFETPAEIRAARILGAQAVGMSTVPEVIIARYLGLRVAALSMITNLAAGMSDEVLSHAHTQAEAAKGSARFKTLITAFCAEASVKGL